MDIVFVHLNTSLPSYLNNNLVRTQKIFPDENIVLISNIAQKSIPGITHFKFDEPPESKQLKNILVHPNDFRNNFWHISIARFAYLLTYQKLFNKKILHFESDVLISSDFPLSKFKKISFEKIAFPVLARKRGVASVFYSGGPKILNTFVNFAISNAAKNPSTTDMLTLRDFYDHYPTCVDLLPAGPDEIQLYDKEIIEDVFPNIKDGLEEFKGVFDGTDIGFYLFGTNPYNRRGISFIRQEIADTYTIMSKFRFEYNVSRNFIDLLCANRKIPIYNLHITSKRQSIFASKSLEKEIKKYLNIKKEKKSIIFSVFLNMLIKKLVLIVTK